jgi:hypothetical protein
MKPKPMTVLAMALVFVFAYVSIALALGIITALRALARLFIGALGALLKSGTRTNLTSGCRRRALPRRMAWATAITRAAWLGQALTVVCGAKSGTGFRTSPRPALRRMTMWRVMVSDTFVWRIGVQAAHAWFELMGGAREHRLHDWRCYMLPLGIVRLP